jgi:quinol monooxygenase YgiN
LAACFTFRWKNAGRGLICSPASGEEGEEMRQETVHVVAMFTAAPGKENELEQLLGTLVEPTRKEAGCIRYDLMRGIPGESGDFVFIEEWESAETLDAHSQSAHLREVGPKVGPLLAAPANIARYRQIR